MSKQLAVKDAKAPCGAMNLYAGGLTISAEGFARVLTILMNDGCYDGVRYLSSESVKNILTAQCAKQGYAKQCLPVAYYPGMYGQDGLYFHTGNRFGVFSVYTFDPVTGVVTIVVSTGAKPVVTSHVAAVCGEISEYVHNLRRNLRGRYLIPDNSVPLHLHYNYSACQWRRKRGKYHVPTKGSYNTGHFVLRKMLADRCAADNLGDGRRNVHNADGGAFDPYRRLYRLHMARPDRRHERDRGSLEVA